ncbi:type II toxin-antitoxin system HicA family toxin [Paraburkholderia sp. MM6662-R1]|uniref:type II toxin-antitoxin system HicA family toxin n=1 Tax=Paraburkholderia sp. MM6662-R1 TaxID=2991066 RepID=UPI003D1B62F0
MTRLNSWIPSTFSWANQDDVFAVLIQSDDLDLVEFIARGRIDVAALHSKTTAKVFAVLAPERSLLCQLTLALWDKRKLGPVGERVRSGLKVIAHCYGVFSLPDKHTLCVLVSRNEPVERQTWIPSDVKIAAKHLVENHTQRIAEIDKKIAVEETQHENNLKAMKGRYDDDAIRTINRTGRFRIARINNEKPPLRADELLTHFPKAVTFPIRRTYALRGVERVARKAIGASPWEPPRDGAYTGLLVNSTAIVTWTTHEGVPSYPEIRWTVQRLIPGALTTPRLNRCSRPEFDAGDVTVAGPPLVASPEDDPEGIVEALDGLQLEEHNFHSRINDIRNEIGRLGFEAMAWFQAYHIWTEDTWGIYVDARKLDDFALSLLRDLRQNGVAASDATAAFLALGLTYSHELFHARIEAASSWLELTSRQPRHLRYKKDVYDTLRETTEWLEEALANWASWKWFRRDNTKALLMVTDEEFARIERVVRASLDLSPPGYDQWKLGERQSTWRIFANQLATGKPSVTNKAPPVEGLLTGSQPYDFQPTDVPFRFVGAGVIADRLHANHKTFSQPTVRELEKALNHFGYRCDPSGGKGSHEKWAKDGKQFPLPRCDPVSQTVFKAFLEQVGIDRKRYFAEVRPKL